MSTDFERYAQTEAQARARRDANFRAALAAAATDEERRTLAAAHSDVTRAETAEGIDADLRALDGDTLDALADYGHRPNMSWEALTLAERKALRARNELARRQRLGAREQAARERDDARQREQVAAAQEEARRLLRAGFAGTDAEFAAAWPGLWARYRDRQALDAAAAGDPALAE